MAQLGAARLYAVGTEYELRFKAIGSRETLEQAIKAKEMAVSSSLDNPDQPEYLAGLALSLLVKFSLTKCVEDLQRAVEVSGQALKLTSEGHIHHHLSSNSMGNVRLAQYERTGDLEHLDEAIRLNADAARLVPKYHPYYVRISSNNAFTLVRRYERFGSETDLNNAMNGLIPIYNELE